MSYISLRRASSNNGYHRLPGRRTSFTHASRHQHFFPGSYHYTGRAVQLAFKMMPYILLFRLYHFFPGSARYSWPADSQIAI